MAAFSRFAFSRFAFQVDEEPLPFGGGSGTAARGAAGEQEGRSYINIDGAKFGEALTRMIKKLCVFLTLGG